jgi:hypothetical protein
MQNKIIGIAGCARSGKDTFFNILKKYLPEVEQVALAGELKKDLDDFVKSKIGISVFTDDTKEKSLIRGLMVEYGKIKRQQTDGAYWTCLAQKKINEILRLDKIPVITDVRYDIYPKDEFHWLKNENNGVMVHITRMFGEDEIPPANEEESINNEKLRSKADYSITWNTVEPSSEASNDANLNEIVKGFIKYYDKFRK